MLTLRNEAGILCKYLCGKQASDALAEKYEMAIASLDFDSPLPKLSLKGIPSSGNLKDANKAMTRDRLILMAALLETDPQYNSMYRNPRPRIIAHLNAVKSGFSGLINRLL